MADSMLHKLKDDTLMILMMMAMRASMQSKWAYTTCTRFVYFQGLNEPDPGSTSKATTDMLGLAVIAAPSKTAAEVLRYHSSVYQRAL